MKVADELQKYLQRINKLLTQYLPPADISAISHCSPHADKIDIANSQTVKQPDNLISPIHEAMRYVVLNGGKRLRPLLVYATGETLQVELTKLDTAACAVEFIHAYSLVHDDLPAMDNDDWRRGQLSCHKAYDEATAILAGDALQTLAFNILASVPEHIMPAEKILEMIKVLSIASGSLGMIGGQMLELTITKEKITLPILENIHQLKTGALIRAATKLGAIAAGANSTEQNALDKFASYLGLAFQIQDDIDDFALPSDDVCPSYPELIGIEKANNKIRELYQLALHELDLFGNAAMPLRCLIDYVIHE